MKELNHRNKSIKENINFFKDYFLFAADFMESAVEITFESHKNILEKILYQIDFNEPNCDQYLESYFQHTLFKRNDPYFKTVLKKYSQLKKLIETIELFPQSSRKIIKEWLNSDSNHKSELLELNVFLKANYHKQIIENLISILKNKKELRYSEDKIVYYTNILITELKLFGYTSINCMNIICDIVNKSKFGYPFPERIKSKEQKRKYLEKVSIFQSVKNFLNLFIVKNNNKTFILRILNYSTPNSSFFYERNGILILSPNHPDLSEIKERKHHKEFIDKEDCLIAIVKLEIDNHLKSIEFAYEKCLEVINFLNVITSHNGFLDKKNYLESSDGINFGGRSYKNYNTNFKLEDSSYYIENFDTETYLAEINNNTKDKFVKLDHLFIDSFNGATSEVKLSGLWQFLEAIIKTPFIEKISHLLIIEEEKHIEKLLRKYFCDKFSPVKNRILYNSEIHVRSIYSNLNGGDFKEATKLIEKHFPTAINKYLLKKLSLFSSKRYLKILKLYKYYLKQLQEIRNFYFHTGVTNSQNTKMMDLEISHIVSRIRLTLLRSIKERKDLNNIDKLIKKLNEEGSNLTKEN